MDASSRSTSEQRLKFFERLAAASAGVDPSGRLESVAFLLGRMSPDRKYEFRLSGGKPSSWTFLTDLGTIRWQGQFSLADPIDRVAAIQVKFADATDDGKLDRLRKLLDGYGAEKLDHLAGLVFVRDLLAATGRPTDDAAILDKYWTTIPLKGRPRKEDLPLEDARAVFSLAA